MDGPTVTRRAVVAAAAAAAWACTAHPVRHRAGAPPKGATQPDRDAQLVRHVVADEQRLVASYRDVLARHPGLRELLRPLLDHHLAHLRVLGGRDAIAGGHDGVSDDMAELARAERADSARRRTDALDARSGDLARVLASIAASHAQHAVVLDHRDTPGAAPPRRASA